MSLTNPSLEFAQLGVTKVIVEEDRGRSVRMSIGEFVGGLPDNEMLCNMYGKQNVLMGLTDMIVARNMSGSYPVQSRIQNFITRFKAKKEAKAILANAYEKLTYGAMQMLLYKLAFGATNRKYLAGYNFSPGHDVMSPYFYYPQTNPFAFDVSKSIKVDESNGKYRGKEEDTTVRLAGACIPYEPMGIQVSPKLGLLWNGSVASIPGGLVQTPESLTDWDRATLNKGYHGDLHRSYRYVDIPGLRIASQIPLDIERVSPLNIIDYMWKYGERTLLYVYSALVPCMHEYSDPVIDRVSMYPRFVAVQDDKRSKEILKSIDNIDHIGNIALKNSGLIRYQ